MPTEPTPVAPQAGDPGNAPQSPGGSPTTPTDAQAAMSQQDYERIIAELRKENAGNRVKLSKIDADEKAKADAQLSEVEKAKKEKADVEAKYQQAQELLITEKVQNAAHKKGIIDPELAALAIAGKLEKDENGMPTNIDKALDELIKNKPYLVPQNDATSPASPARTGAPALPPMSPERGRSSIPSPTGNIPGVKHKLSEFL